MEKLGNKSYNNLEVKEKMANVELYRRYRPEKIEDVGGNGRWKRQISFM